MLCKYWGMAILDKNDICEHCGTSIIKKREKKSLENRTKFEEEPRIIRQSKANVCETVQVIPPPAVGIPSKEISLKLWRVIAAIFWVLIIFRLFGKLAGIFKGESRRIQVEVW